MHNFCPYDAHLILRAVKPRHGDVSAIPNNNEKYTSFTVGDVTFIDSFQFMQSLLDILSRISADGQYQEMLRYLKSDYGGKLCNNPLDTGSQKMLTKLISVFSQKNYANVNLTSCVRWESF